MKTTFAVLSLCVVLSGCSLLDLRSNLASIEQGYRRARADLEFTGESPTVLVLFAEDEHSTIETFDIVNGSGALDLWVPAKRMRAFAFVDGNGDLSYQPGELCASAEVDPGATTPNVETLLALHLPDVACSSRNAPPQMMNSATLQWTEAAALRASFAETTTLDDVRFSAEQASAGMWRPLEFVKANVAGLFMLQPYDPRRVPVLFVHGLVGSPRDFRYLIDHLDQSRFQPWVLSYPSGLALQDIARSMHRVLARTRYKLRFDELHIVAHSMGGLVVRGYVNECMRMQDCDYLRSFTSIASPFGGHAAAEHGINLAPVVAPVWRDMAPGSDYLKALFTKPLPESLPHNLVFTFHHEGLGNTSSDGTIEVWSQLLPEAQQQAAKLHGFDETHMSVLNSAAVAKEVAEFLAASASRGKQRLADATDPSRPHRASSATTVPDPGPDGKCSSVCP